jgi:hypothetical protein
MRPAKLSPATRRRRTHDFDGNSKTKDKTKPRKVPDWDHPEGEFLYHDAGGKVAYKNVRYPLNNPDGTPAFSPKGKRDKTSCHVRSRREWWLEDQPR